MENLIEQAGAYWPLVLNAAKALVVLIVGWIAAGMIGRFAKRKVMAAMQIRRGPNVVGPFGLLQPFADGLKLLMKETIIPAGSNRVPTTCSRWPTATGAQVSAL